MDTLYTLYAEHGSRALNWALTAGVGLLMTYVVAKLRWEAARNIIGRALGELQDAVLEVNQTYVDALKAARLPGSPGGERLTPEEKREAKSRAIAIAKSNLGSKGLARLARVIGIDIDSWFASKTESIVKSVKAAANPPLA